MSKRINRAYTRMKNIFMSEEEDIKVEESNLRNTNKQIYPYEEEPRVLHKYPKKEEGIENVKKGVVHLSKKTSRRQLAQKEETQLPIRQTEGVDHWKKRSQSSRERKKKAEEKSLFKGNKFVARESPSPVFGYKSRTDQHGEIDTDREVEKMVEEERPSFADIIVEKNLPTDTKEAVIAESMIENNNVEKVDSITEERNTLNRAERRRQLREERKKGKQNLLSKPIKVAPRVDRLERIETSYSFPPVDLLNVAQKVSHEKDNEWIEDQVEKLNDTFEHFAIRAKVVHVTRGPSVTRFEVQPEPGVKVSKITNLTDDLKLSLAAKEIRMEAPIPGKNTIGIEVPNLVSEPVFLREIITDPVFKNSASPLTVSLGKDISGQAVVTDLQKMPHGLIAGATGSGKSVCINSIIVSLLYKASPEEVRLLLIDPKMVELAPYNGVPHLATPVITDPKEAKEGLKWAVDEMERRYELFAKNGVRDLKRYNTKLKEEDKNEDVLPYIVIIVDELADLMMVSPSEVEEAICRIAQKARACGIHLLVATQRPSVDVVTGLIKSNIPTRIAFSVSSQIDSRTIIDSGGAEKLLGKGDMLLLENGTNKPVRLQGTFVADEEIDKIVAYVQADKQEYDYLFERETLKLSLENVESDELFKPACQFVSEQQTASVSLLQRHFRIGYNRAARLIDEMEEKGVVSGANGSKPRDVFITADDLMEI